jgi:hypothetical protein
MNERIKELAEQAMESTGIEGLGGSYMELNTEKFAELIVKECCQLVEDTPGVAWDDIELIIKTIQENFGIQRGMDV